MALTVSCDAGGTSPGGELAAPADEASPPSDVALQLAAYRPDDPASNDLFRFTPGYDVERFDGELVRVHFTRSGPDRVREADEDASGIPDAVELIAETYDEVLDFYPSIGFRAPLTDLGTSQGDGGDGRLDVYLIDFAGSSDGAWVRERCEAGGPRCSGYVVQENDFSGYSYPSFRVASRILASHELFHAVQAAYDANQGANWSEATAVWASERFDPSLSDLEGFAYGWLEKPDRSIGQDPIGPVDAYSYGLSIFAQYLFERLGDEIHLELWEAVEDGAGGVADPHWLSTLAELLEREFETSFADEWVTFATWVLRCGHGDVGGPTLASAEVLPRVEREVINSGFFSDDRLRVYPASMQVWSLAGGVIAASVVGVAEGDTEGLVLVTATRKGDSVKTTVHEGLEATIEAPGDDEVMVTIVNTNLEGNSKRPGFCVGPPDEVAACVAELAPVAPEPEPEASPEPVAEEGPEEAAETVEETAEAAAEAEAPTTGGGGDDGGCAGSGPIVGALWALLAALVMARRTHLRNLG